MSNICISKDLENIFNVKKIKLLSDAIINMKEFSKKKYIDNDFKPKKSEGDFFSRRKIY